MTGGCWVGTIDGNATAGTTKNGFTITASGTDENGDPVTGYVLGKGDFSVLDAGETPQPDAPFAYVHLLDAESEEPKTGDLYPVSGDYYIWQNGQRNQLGGGVTKEELATKADVSALGDYLPLSGDEDAQVAVDVLSSSALFVGRPQYEGVGNGVLAYEGHVSIQEARHTQTANYYGTDIAGDGSINQYKKEGQGEVVTYAELRLPRKTGFAQMLATTDDIEGAVSAKADVSALSGYLPFDPLQLKPFRRLRGLPVRADTH